MVEEQALSQDRGHEERVEQVRHLCRTDPDPRARRAHGVLLVEQGHSQAEVARFFGTAPHRVYAWQDRFLADGAPAWRIARAGGVRRN